MRPPDLVRLPLRGRYRLLPRRGGGRLGVRLRHHRLRLCQHDDLRRRAEQAERTLRNIEAALAEAGSGFADVVRVRYILPNAADFPACWPALRAAFGETRPAATMIAAGLADPRMKIEIEVTARKQAQPAPDRQ